MQYLHQGKEKKNAFLGAAITMLISSISGYYALELFAAAFQKPKHLFEEALRIKSALLTAKTQA